MSQARIHLDFTFLPRFHQPFFRLQMQKQARVKNCLLHLACGMLWFSLPSTPSVANCSRHAAMQSGPNFKHGLVERLNWFL